MRSLGDVVEGCGKTSMKPYRTEQEALEMLQGKPDHKPYRELLERIPCMELRELMDRRLDGKYKHLKLKNEFEIVRHFDWSETPEGSGYWGKVVGWMAGMNDLPELAKELKSAN